MSCVPGKQGLAGSGRKRCGNRWGRPSANAARPGTHPGPDGGADPGLPRLPLADELGKNSASIETPCTASPWPSGSRWLICSRWCKSRCLRRCVTLVVQGDGVMTNDEGKGRRWPVRSFGLGPFVVFSSFVFRHSEQSPSSCQEAALPSRVGNPEFRRPFLLLQPLANACPSAWLQPRQPDVDWPSLELAPGTKMAHDCGGRPPTERRAFHPSEQHQIVP